MIINVTIQTKETKMDEITINDIEDMADRISARKGDYLADLETLTELAYRYVSLRR